jgi:hypothetical protein
VGSRKRFRTSGYGVDGVLGPPRRSTVRTCPGDHVENLMRDDMLTTILNDLNGSSVDIEASPVVSADGLMMAS